MQIVIPMSGFGERFRRAGYEIPKPLIEVDGKPIIAHVIDMFPGETNLIFVCSEDHLATPEFHMAEQIHRYCPTGRIVGIAPHKLGPVHAVMQVADLLDPDEPTIVNYCDFTCVWDYADFKAFVHDSACDGAIPCYTGFHPHMLGSTYYAYVRTDGQRITHIQEKQPYTDSPMAEYASSGTYYYASAAMMLDSFTRLVQDPELAVNGEYFASIAYRPLLEDGRRIAVYALNHFMQWGTPRDLADYRYWSDAFRGMVAPARASQRPQQAGTVLVPMAGLGSRYANEGYATPKPLIPVSGEAMVVQATQDLPEPQQHVFVLRRDLHGHDAIAAQLRRRFPGCTLVELDEVTDGQARTCMAGMQAVAPDQPVTIGACDNGALFDRDTLCALLADPGTDVIVWVARGYPNAVRRPAQTSWVVELDGLVQEVQVKQAPDDAEAGASLIGAFTFKRASDFTAACVAMFARDGRVNGEFYVDACINDAIAAGLHCRAFAVDSFLCWGTPDDLRTFEYWQSCLHKWPSHPYRLEDDPRVAEASREALVDRYGMWQPARIAW